MTLDLLRRLLFVLPFCASFASASSSLPRADGKPNIVIILVDDMGYSDIGCYGGEIQTPNLDKLAANGMKFSQMYNTAKCYTTRASLMTGVYFQRTDRNFSNTATLGEVLQPAGYRTLWSGKHHANFDPRTRGFDRFYGLLGGAQNHFNPGSKPAPGQPRPGTKGDRNRWVIDGEEVKDFVPADSSYYDTDAFTDHALKWLQEYAHDDAPFFLYLSYTAPHWPLQAWPEDVAKYDGVYDAGYESIRQARYSKQIELGLVDPDTAPLSPMEMGRKGSLWSALALAEREKEIKRMAIYAAMVDRVDQNIGRLVAQLEEQGAFDNTLILFLADNGACAEYPKVKYVDPAASMGSVGSYDSYGVNWATVGNTPLRKWKSSSHEGGIRTPLVAHWPTGIKPQLEWNREPFHLIDLMPTILELAEAHYPGGASEVDIPPFDGISMLPAFSGQVVGRNGPLFFEFNKGAAIRDGRWKMVRLGSEWELYDMEIDWTETNNLANAEPEMMASLTREWETWWRQCTGADYPSSATK